MEKQGLTQEGVIQVCITTLTTAGFPKDVAIRECRQVLEAELPQTSSEADELVPEQSTVGQLRLNYWREGDGFALGDVQWNTDSRGPEL